MKKVFRISLFFWLTAMVLIATASTVLSLTDRTDNTVIDKEGSDIKDQPMCIPNIPGAAEPKCITLIRFDSPPAPPIGPDGQSDTSPETDLALQNWRGFALKGNESHALRVSIESIKPIEPMSARKLLSSNKSIEEVRAEIRKEEGAVTYQGVMRLNSSVFRLINITMTPTGNKTHLESDVAELQTGNPGQPMNSSLKVAGHISVNLVGENSSQVSEGTLQINSNGYQGQYKVLLANMRFYSIVRVGDLK